MLGWVGVQEAQARRKGLEPSEVDTKGMWNCLKCSPAMYWIAEGAGVDEQLLHQAEKQAETAAAINPADGDPHGKMFRKVLPWAAVVEAILKNATPEDADHADIQAWQAFDRLTSMRSDYRKWREWAK